LLDEGNLKLKHARKSLKRFYEKLNELQDWLKNINTLRYICS
jgi:abortive infection bacteriophage resistance protein